jgi:hypothetical protein
MSIIFFEIGEKDPVAPAKTAGLHPAHGNDYASLDN